MLGSNIKRLLIYISLFIVVNPANFSQAEVFSEHLSVISSADPESNAKQSFIIIKKGTFITQGIKHSSKQSKISQQTPFVIKYTAKTSSSQLLKWNIKVLDKQHGTIKLLSEFTGNGRMLGSGYQWQSDLLDENIKDRQQLIFRPAPFSPRP